MVPNYKAITRRTVFDGVTLGFVLVIALMAMTSPDEQEMLLLGRNSLIVLACFVAGSILSYIANKAGLKTLGELIFESAHQKAIPVKKGWYQKFYNWQALILFILTFLVGAYKTEFSLRELTDPAGLEGAQRLLTGLLQFNFEILPEAVLNIIETIFMAFMATILAVPFAFLFSFLCAKNIMRHPVGRVFYFIFRTSLSITRSVEALIWAIIFSVWVGIGPFAGMLALMLHSIASLTKQYSEMVESVSDGPIEGIQATGANKIQIIWFAVVPQILLPYISFTIYRWDINVRMATVIGLVGGGGIGTMLMQYQGQARWPEVGCIILVIAVVVWLMDQASAFIREAIK